MKRIINWCASLEALCCLAWVVGAVWLIAVICVGLDTFLQLKPGDMSGWVQAIGSIAAIISAIVIAGRQTRREQAAKRHDQRVMVMIVLDIAKRCNEVASAEKPVHRPTVYDTAIGRKNHELEKIEKLYLELQGLELPAVGSPGVVLATIELRGAVNELLARIMAVSDGSLSALTSSSKTQVVSAKAAVAEAASRLIAACSSGGQ